MTFALKILMKVLNNLLRILLEYSSLIPMSKLRNPIPVDLLFLLLLVDGRVEPVELVQGAHHGLHGGVPVVTVH